MPRKHNHPKCVYIKHTTKHVKQKLTKLKGKIDTSTVAFGDFNTLLSIIDRTTRQKVSKDIEKLNNTINHQDLIGIYRTLSPTTTECTFKFPWNIYARVNHILGHKASSTN